MGRQQPVQAVGRVDESHNPRQTECSRAVVLVEVEEVDTSPALPLPGQLAAQSMTQELR